VGIEIESATFESLVQDLAM